MKKLYTTHIELVDFKDLTNYDEGRRENITEVKSIGEK